MAYQVVLNPKADSDLSEAFAYYERQQTGLGRDFLACVEDVFSRLRDSPQMHALTYRSVRQTLVRRFPFVVCYTIEDDWVIVIAVFHGRRDPAAWKRRASKPT